MRDRNRPLDTLLIVWVLIVASCATEGGNDRTSVATAHAQATGSVKWYRAEEGYGAIVTDERPPREVWVHFSAIDDAGYKSLKPGQRVELNYEEADQDGFKHRATYVRVLR
jgi:CspA family cold shock protein